jgi:hypothetical protein
MADNFSVTKTSKLQDVMIKTYMAWPYQSVESPRDKTALLCSPIQDLELHPEGKPCGPFTWVRTSSYIPRANRAVPSHDQDLELPPAGKPCGPFSYWGLELPHPGQTVRSLS